MIVREDSRESVAHNKFEIRPHFEQNPPFCILYTKLYTLFIHTYYTENMDIIIQK